jgi:hypothetical protein
VTQLDPTSPSPSNVGPGVYNPSFGKFKALGEVDTALLSIPFRSKHERFKYREKEDVSKRTSASEPLGGVIKCHKNPHSRKVAFLSGKGRLEILR